LLINIIPFLQHKDYPIKRWVICTICQNENVKRAKIQLPETAPTTQLNRHIKAFHRTISGNEDEGVLVENIKEMDEKVGILKGNDTVSMNVGTLLIKFLQDKMALFKRMLSCFIAVTNVPMSIVDEWAFQQLILLWNPNVKFPGRRGIRNHIFREFKSEKERIIHFFNSRTDLKV